MDRIQRDRVWPDMKDNYQGRDPGRDPELLDRIQNLWYNGTWTVSTPRRAPDELTVLDVGVTDVEATILPTG
jgi:hypothetical protein